MILPIIGSTYISEASDANSRECVNMYPIMTGVGARGQPSTDPNFKVALVPSSGLYELIDLGGLLCRGMITVGSYTYVVVDASVYRLSINISLNTASSLLLGTIGTSSGYVKMSSNPTQLIIVDGSTSGYIVTLSTGAFTTISDVDFTGGTHVLFADSYFIYNQPNTAKMWASLQNDGTSWDALDVGTAEYKPDNLVGLALSRQNIWAIGEKSVEVWYDAANPTGFPYSVRVGSGFDIGCAAAGSIIETNDVVIWLDNRGYIVQSQVDAYLNSGTSGYTVNIISDESIKAAINSYTTISDAIATSYIERGHLFYQITFPSEYKTWVYDQTTQIWFERSSFNTTLDSETAHLIQFVNTIQTTNVACGLYSGKIYIMSTEFKDDDGVGIRRKLVSNPYSFENRLITPYKLQLRMGSGYANPSGDGADPQINLRCSTDGGHIWSSYRARDIGLTGSYGKPITWNNLGTQREWRFELSICEPIDFSIIEASASVEVEPEDRS